MSSYRKCEPYRQVKWSKKMIVDPDHYINNIVRKIVAEIARSQPLIVFILLPILVGKIFEYLMFKLNILNIFKLNILN